jgi:hypothetical protein
VRYSTETRFSAKKALGASAERWEVLTSARENQVGLAVIVIPLLLSQKEAKAELEFESRSERLSYCFVPCKSYRTRRNPDPTSERSAERIRLKPNRVSRNPDIPTTAYLQDPHSSPGFDIKVEPIIQPAETEIPTRVCKSDFSSLYWTLRDLAAQQTVDGCGLSTEDLLTTGTISGTTPESHRCLLETAAKGGVTAVTKGREEKRKFLLDGDTVTLSAVAGKGVGLGECIGVILPGVH